MDGSNNISPTNPPNTQTVIALTPPIIVHTHIIYILIYGIVMLKINKIISGIGFIYGVLNSLYNKVREPRDIILLIEK